MNNYVLGEKIGSGGMGVVHKAHHQGLHRDVAVKFLHAHLADDAEAVERFLREARLIARMDHPNIVRVTDTGRWDDGRPYLVMELLGGESLAERLARGPLPEPEAVEVACQVLEALSVAHREGIVHRDIKPGNVRLCPGGVAKLLDFGIARASAGTALSGTGSMIGTPAYMSPEQAEGKTAGPSSDLYSVGILLYEMLTGDVPFKADTPLVVLRMHTDRPVPKLPDGVSKRTRRAVERALEKKPDRRPADAAAMIRELRSGPTTETPPRPVAQKMTREPTRRKAATVVVCAFGAFLVTYATPVLDPLWKGVLATSVRQAQQAGATQQPEQGTRLVTRLKSKTIPNPTTYQAARRRAPGTVTDPGYPGLEIERTEVVVGGDTNQEGEPVVERVIEPKPEVVVRG